MNTKPSVSQDEVEEWFEDEASEAPAPTTAEMLDPAEKYARSQLRVVRGANRYCAGVPETPSMDKQEAITSDRVIPSQHPCATGLPF